MAKRKIIVDGFLAYVPLTKGYQAVIDAADVHIVEPYSWTAHEKRGVVYAKRAEKVDGITRIVRMHRVIARAQPGELVDHINGDGLDNRRMNLRFATNSENLCNRGAQSNNTSGHKGVTWSKAAGKWTAQIKRHGRVHYLGIFENLEDAVAARKAAEPEHHGAFAKGAVS